MAQSDAQEGKWRGNWRMVWVASTLHTTSEHVVSSITTADAHNSAGSSRPNWRPPVDLNGLVRFAERRNLVSARVPSHFNWPLRMYVIHTSNHDIFAYHAGEHNLSTYSWTSLIWTLFIRIVNFPGRLGLSGKSVENSTKLTYLEITVHRIKYSTVLWLIELQIRRGRTVQTPVCTVNSNSWKSNC